jgi:hypothetical protein
MKYMFIMRVDNDITPATPEDADFGEILESMGRYNESMIAAGIMLSGEGLSPAEEGFVVDFSSTPPAVTDGPYGETKELFNGFWIVDVATREEAAEWAGRAPLGPGVKLEVRRVPGIEEFDQDNDAVKREKAWREENGQL